MENRASQRALTMTGAILGSYRITGLLATGGMGQVFRAEHVTLEKPAAVKVLRKEYSKDEALVQRFFTEAKAASAIRSPHVIEVYDFGYTDEGNAYLAMELLEGQTLAARIAARGKLGEGDAATIARGIASALVAAHGKGIVHRDLKPDNVFLVGIAGTPKVLDFGIAKLVEAATSHTQTGALLGTPLYMAPEQARAARSIDHRADLYSLGCILFEMLAGKPPFAGDGAGELIAMHMFTDVDPAPLDAAHVGPELRALVLQLLAKEPADRPASAQEVVEALAKHAEVATAVQPAQGTFTDPSLPLRPHHLPKVALADEAPPTLAAPAKPNLRIPILAGAATVGLVVVLAVVVLARGGGSSAAIAEPVAADAAPVAAVEDVAPAPKAGKPARPAPPKQAAQAAHVDATSAPAAPPRQPASKQPARPAQPSGAITSPTLDPPAAKSDVITQPKLETKNGSPADNGQLPDP